MSLPPRYVHSPDIFYIAMDDEVSLEEALADTWAAAKIPGTLDDITAIINSCYHKCKVLDSATTLFRTVTPTPNMFVGPWPRLTLKNVDVVRMILTCKLLFLPQVDTVWNCAGRTWKH